MDDLLESKAHGGIVRYHCSRDGYQLLGFSLEEIRHWP
jgi:hypothetical protein